MAPSGIPSLRLFGLSSHESHATSSTPSSTPSPLATSVSSFSDGNSTSEQSFMRSDGTMPSPGPAYYEARRAVWLTPPPGQPRSPSPSTSRAKLDTLLSQEGAIESNDVWNAGLRSVWKGLVGGGRLRRRLPLATVLKILQAGWLRDGTWPADAITGPPSPLTAPTIHSVQMLGSSPAQQRHGNMERDDGRQEDGEDPPVEAG